jgi:TDG/mug DNA glycosylase family protein
VRIHSFEPVADASSRLLILGSMPGRASLRAGQYYAHPRNLFWSMIGSLFEIDPVAPYAQRVRGLCDAGIALWDVLKSCTRTSSLDSDIDDSSIVVNEFDEFLPAHPAIRTVCFNGAKAEQVYRRYVLPELPEIGDVTYHRLPSTSPANASIPPARKLECWRAALCGD